MSRIHPVVLVGTLLLALACSGEGRRSSESDATTSDASDSGASIATSPGAEARALLDGDRSVRLRVTLPNGALLPATSFTILNDDLGFVPGGSFAFPNGRFLMNVTGNFTRTNVRIEISSDLLGWGEWQQMPNDLQVINLDAPNDKQLFYRLVSE